MAVKTKRFVGSRKSCSCSMPGVWRAVAYCTGCAVIFHSPRACAHVARSMDINAHYRTIAEGRQELRGSVPLLCSQLEEKHSIFGGVERLQQCIRFTMEKYRPACLVIASSCVAGVIGDDVSAAAREAEAEYGIPVLTADCCGFLDGEYYQGYFAIAEQLAERFFRPAPRRPGTVLLLGDNGGPWGHYAAEVRRLLAGMQVQVIGQFPGYMPWKELPQAATAEAAIILGGRGQTHSGLSRLAAKIQERCGIPYLDVYPVGWQQTEKWLLAAGRLLHREAAAELLLRQERERLDRETARMLPVTGGRRVLLCLGRQLQYYHPAGVLETIGRLRLQLTGVVLLDAYSAQDREEMLAAVRQYTDVPVYSAAEAEGLPEAAELVLTTHELQSRSIKQLFLPMLPKAGTTGELEFMQAVYRALLSRLRGGVIYV